MGVFLAFAVRENPDGRLAHTTAFLPNAAPMTVPQRIVSGGVPVWEIVAALLMPLAWRTGSALTLREA